MQKRVAIIGSAGIPANYGGFETLAENLVKELKDNFRFIVYCSAFSYKNKPSRYWNAHLVYIPIKANGRSSILYDVVSIVRGISKADLLLVLGVGGAFLFPLIRIFSKRIIVVNIDGLEWKREKWGAFAKFYLRVQERIAVKFAHKVIADNEDIQTYLKTRYNRESCYTPYGGNHVRHVSMSESTRKKYNIEGGGYYFSVCRIEPENNIHIILDAFSTFSDLKLIIVGNWNASGYGKSLIQSYKNHLNIQLLDPIYDLSKLDELRSNCFCYIHGHSAGGTNPSLVEAMTLGLSILAWDVAYNRYTTENQALYFKSRDELQELIRRIDKKGVNLNEIADSLRSVAREKYSWNLVAKKYQQIFLD